MDGKKKLKIAMYPWFEFGHLTIFIHISNKLAQLGHQIFFIHPPKAHSKLNQLNLHPDLIKFIPIAVPHVAGLPPGTETTADVTFRFRMYKLIRRAMDLTEPDIKNLLLQLKPDIVFLDFADWLPALARSLGIKTVHYCIISPAAMAYFFRDEPNADAYLLPPPGFPPSTIKLYAHEARVIHAVNKDEEFRGSGVKFVQRLIKSAEECDAIGFKSSREMEGPYIDFIVEKFKKPVVLAGPVLAAPPTSTLDERWTKWLDQCKPKSVIYCAFGSEARLKRDQFQELLVGFELTGLPFFAALKPPVGAETVEEALPEGFASRTAKRGVVFGGWVQQQLILAHNAVGCFVTHCGWGSLSQALVNDCQMVLIPHMGDQLVNGRLMGGDLKIGVEVEKGNEDGLFSREGVVKAIELVMDEKSEIGIETRENRSKWKDFMLRKGLEESYLDEMDNKLHGLLEQ